MSDVKDKAASVDLSLEEVRAIRSLEAIAASIESFLANQIDRIGFSLNYCQEAFTQHRLLQQRTLEFENEKSEFETMQKRERQRLFEICEKLIAGWEQLENQSWDSNDGKRKARQNECGKD